ncbi:MAG TPA: substrate-binding domain-containing protein [Terracidiphilus sp.]|nr:substrate-binding domain-containing protein [Terracidiphilus sp.]
MRAGRRRLTSATVSLAAFLCRASALFVPISALAQATQPTVVPSENIGSQTISPEQRTLNGLPHYQPQQLVTGTIRLWGHGAPILDFMGMLVKSWEEGFAKFQPGVKFEYDMYGTASAMGALYTGKGDIAILGQEIYPFETTAFEQVKHYPPLGIEIATGSVDVRNFDFAIGVFVNKRNALSQMTLDQIDKVFAWHEGGRAANIETWGQLGLTGEWADKPIHLYGWYEGDVFSTFVEHAALHDSHRWRCGMKQYAHIHKPDGTIYDSGQQILDDLSNDPYGIALSNVRYLKEGDAVKPLSLARTVSGLFYAATKETLINRQYPLGRIIPAQIDRVPGQPVDPKVKEFLRYILSREGQEDIVRNGKYLPMQPEAAERERKKLD